MRISSPPKMSAAINKVLKSIYYDEKTGFRSAKQLLVQAQEKFPRLQLTDVKEWLANQASYQVTKRRMRPRKNATPSISGYYPRYCYQIDILVYTRYEVHGYRYILMVIDVYSRFLMAIPLKTREMSEIMNALVDICQENDYPDNISADNEFNKAPFLLWCDTYDIKPWFSDPNEPYKNAIVERVNGTLATILQRWREGTGKTDWVTALPSLLANYNTTIHSTTGKKPKTVFARLERSEQVLKPRRRNVKVNDSRWIGDTLKVGDQVRIKQYQGVFDKGDAISFSRDVYTVISIDGQRVIVQDNSTGMEERVRYKPNQLQRIIASETFEPEPELEDGIGILPIPRLRERSQRAKTKKPSVRVRREVKDLEASGPVQIGKRRITIRNVMDL